MLNRNKVMGVTLIAKLLQISQYFVFKKGKVFGVNTHDGITGHVMFSAESKHAIAGRGFPPEGGGDVKADERPVAVCAHVQVFNAGSIEKIIEAPAGTVDVVLHRKLDVNAFFLETT